MIHDPRHKVSGRDEWVTDAELAQQGVKRKFMKFGLKIKNNLQHYVADFSKSGLFLWYSSNTVKNQKGSLLCYMVMNGEIDAWYASFANRKKWTVEKVKGIDREKLCKIL